MKSHLLILASALLLSACTPAPASPEAPDTAPLPPAFPETSPAPEDAAPTPTPAPALSEPQPAPQAQAPAIPAPAPAQLPQPQPKPQPQQAATQRDPRLVGVWVNENIINSGGSNFASYTTLMTMEIYPDGRVVQYTESIGGGSDWSYGGGRTMDFQGEWRGDGKTFFVYGMGLPDYTPAATYSFSGGYLVTQSDMGRLIWQKRG